MGIYRWLFYGRLNQTFFKASRCSQIQDKTYAWNSFHLVQSTFYLLTAQVHANTAIIKGI